MEFYSWSPRDPIEHGPFKRQSVVRMLADEAIERVGQHQAGHPPEPVGAEETDGNGNGCWVALGIRVIPGVLDVGLDELREVRGCDSRLE